MSMSDTRKKPMDDSNSNFSDVDFHTVSNEEKNNPVSNNENEIKITQPIDEEKSIWGSVIRVTTWQGRMKKVLFDWSDLVVVHKK